MYIFYVTHFVVEGIPRPSLILKTQTVPPPRTPSMYICFNALFRDAIGVPILQ